MAKKKETPLNKLNAELKEKVPDHEHCELLNRYMLSDFFSDTEPGGFIDVLEHMFRTHDSVEAANMAVAIYTLNAESAMREKELFVQYGITSPSRYDPSISDPTAVTDLKTRLQELRTSQPTASVH